MKKHLISFLKNLPFLLLGVGLVIWIFRSQDMGELQEKFWEASYGWVILAKLIALFSHYLRALRWNMLMAPLNYLPKVSRTYHAVMVGYMANLVFPRLGELFRCWALNKTDTIPVNASFGTVITERVIDVLTTLLLVVFVLAVQFDTVGSFFREKVYLPLFDKMQLLTLHAWIYAFTGIIVIGLLLLFFFRKAIARSVLGQRVRNFIKGLWAGMISVRQVKNIPLFVILSIAIWTCYFVDLYFCFKALPATKELGLMAAIFIFTASVLAMAAPIQGGVGAYHWMVTQALVILGVATADGLVLATIAHTSIVILFLVGGGISLLAILLIQRKANKNLQEAG